MAELLIIWAIAWAFKGAWEHTKAAYQRSRDDRLAEVAKTYPGGVIPEPQRAAIARHHALGYWGAEVMHGFPVTRTGLHAGWIAHKTATARAAGVLADAHLAHEGAAQSFRQKVDARREAQRQALAESEAVFADPAADVPADGGADAAEAAAGIARARLDPQCIFCGTDLESRPNDGLAHGDCAEDENPAGRGDSWDEPLPGGWENPDAGAGPGLPLDDPRSPDYVEPPDEDALHEDEDASATTNPNGENQMPADTIIGTREGAVGTDATLDGDAGTDLASTKGASGALKSLATSLTAQIDGIIGNLTQNHADPTVIAHFEQMQEMASELDGLADQSGSLLGGVHTDIADAHAAAGGQDHVADTPWYAEA